MSFDDLRNRVERLLTGEYGVTRTISLGRFRVKSTERDLPTWESSERAVLVDLGALTDLEGVSNNPLDNFYLYDLPLTISVFYAVTKAGGDLTESLNRLDGSGEYERIKSRINDDLHSIRAVIEWHENWSGTDPVMFDLYVSGTPTPKLESNGQIIRLDIPCTMRIRATTPGSYSPTVS